MSVPSSLSSRSSLSSLFLLLAVVVLSSSPLHASSLPSPPNFQSSRDASSLPALLAYWAQADNSYAANHNGSVNAASLLSASTTLFSYFASPLVDDIPATTNDTTPILNFRSLYDYWAPYKKYVVARGFELYLAKVVTTAQFVEFLAAAVSDYSTLDQQTVLLVLNEMQSLLGEGDNTVWSVADVQASSRQILQDATYVVQQCYHATSLTQAGLTNASIVYKAPPGASAAAPPTINSADATASALFSATDAALHLELAHLVTSNVYANNVTNQATLQYNRSLTAAFARMPTNSTRPLTITTRYGFNSTLDFPAAYSAPSSTPSTMYVQMAQVDGWGDRISYDIFPTVLVAIASADVKPPQVDPSYTAGSVSLTFGYTQQNCNDGWVNSGKFRFQQQLGNGTGDCKLTCAMFDPLSQNFSSTTVTQGTWDTLANTIQCLITVPGYYTVLKENIAIQTPNTTRTDQIVTARATLKSLPIALLNDLPRLTTLAADDLTYLLDVPPTRIEVQNVTQSADGAVGDMDVQFRILSAYDPSTTTSAQLFNAFQRLNIENTSHTVSFQYLLTKKSSCLIGCDSSSSSKMSETEIIAIAVVVGFFGTIILGVLLTLCCCQMKYWWDRHDFRPAQIDEDDTELAGASVEYGGVQSARQRAEESKKRRSTRVSWYNKQDVETAASYTYSRNSRSNSGASDSGKAPVFRVRSNSQGSVGSVDDGLQLDEVEVVGGADDVSLEDLAEIGIVMDGLADGKDEDSYVMDGHKVKAVKQVHEVDAEDVDDSKFSRSHSASQLSEYSANEQESSVNSRNSQSGQDTRERPLSLQYGGNAEDEATTPRTPRTPGGGKRAFYYNSGK